MAKNYLIKIIMSARQELQLNLHQIVSLLFILSSIVFFTGTNATADVNWFKT